MAFEDRVDVAVPFHSLLISDEEYEDLICQISELFLEYFLKLDPLRSESSEARSSSRPPVSKEISRETQ